jgi:N-methylhydantoinase A
VCFGHGGTEPTVTDANVVLARINADDPIGLTNLTRLDVEAARAAIGKLGEQLGLGIEATAEAILAIVNQNMAGRTRLLSIERGYDPRDFALVIFGGAGPLHGAAIILEVGIKTMIVPPAPGVLCAMGCVVADVRYDVSRTVARATSGIDGDELHQWMAEQEAEGIGKLRESGVAIQKTIVRHFAEMAYVGQIHTLRVAVEDGWGSARIDQAFAEAYRAEYGNTLGDIATTIVSLRTVVEGKREHEKRHRSAPPPAPAPAPHAHRQVHFGKWWETPIYKRESLRPGAVITGPCIVEQSDTTTIIEPGMIGRVDAYDNILVEIA